MSGFIICRAPREDDSARILELYRTMPTNELRRLRTAFLLDREGHSNSDTIAFCDGRLALLDQVLREREVLT